MLGNQKDAYQSNHENVFVHGCGTGFHNQIMASNSLNLGFSATAMHYVSEKPCEIEKHVHMVGATKLEHNLFARQAAKDWEKILLARSNELKKGGRFVVLNFGIDEQGRYLGNTGGHSMFDKFTHHWRSLQADGTITENEFKRATFAQHYRTLEEFKAPFDDTGSSVSKSGLRLKSIRTQVTRCPYEQNYYASNGTMSSEEFAASLIPTMRSWSETVFSSALVDRKPSEAQAIVNKFYKSYEEDIAAAPDGHGMDYVHAIMEIEKA